MSATNTPVILNCTGDTFTVDRSGAIGTWIAELSMAGARSGSSPLVMSRTSDGEPQAWADVHWLEYPRLPSNRFARKGLHVVTRQLGYHHDRQWKYNRGVTKILRDILVPGRRIVLHNDPELAGLIKARFPESIVQHIFHNQNEFSSRFDTDFGKIDYHFGVSKFTTDWLMATGKTDNKQAEVLYGGVNQNLFYPGDGCPEKPYIINFIGLMNEKKGTDVLLDACRLIADRGVKFRIQLAGGPVYGSSEVTPYIRRLQKSMRHLTGQGIDVDWLGYVSRTHVPAILRRAAINVVPSRWAEPFGLVALEGMASGCATVVSKTGGLPETVGGAGLLFDVGDVTACATHLERLIGDDEYLLRMRSAAIKRSFEFSWDDTWARLSALDEKI